MLFNLIDSFQNQLESLGLWSALQVLYQEEFRALAAVLIGFTIVMLLGRRTIAWLVKRKVGDAPEFYNADLNDLMRSRTGTPTMGGILICGSILLTAFLLADLGNRYVQLAFLLLVWLAVVGGFDDWLKLTAARRSPGQREGLFAWEKLLFQLGIAFLVCFAAYEHASGPDAFALNLPFQRTYPPAQLDDTIQLPFMMNPQVIVFSGFFLVLITPQFFIDDIRLIAHVTHLTIQFLLSVLLIVVLLVWRRGGEGERGG